MTNITNEELARLHASVSGMVPESFVRRSIEELVLRRTVDSVQQPFPTFNLGPEGETAYQTYHRGFKDGWNSKPRYK